MAIEIINGGAYRFAGNNFGNVRSRLRQENIIQDESRAQPVIQHNRSQREEAVRRVHEQPYGEQTSENQRPRRGNPLNRDERAALAAQIGRLERQQAPVTNNQVGNQENPNPNSETQRTERLDIARTAGQNAFQQQNNNQGVGSEFVNNFANREMQVGGRINLTV